MECDEMLRIVDSYGWLWMVMDGYGWLWMVMDGYGWLDGYGIYGYIRIY